VGISDFGPIGTFDHHIKNYLSAKFQPDSPKDLFPYILCGILYELEMSKVEERKENRKKF